jgi:predicted AAA+ superfamily ATPase
MNLVRNVGFGDEATHTRGDSSLSRRAIFEIETPLKHPEFIVHSEDALREILKKRFFIPDDDEKKTDRPLIKRILHKLHGTAGFLKDQAGL